MKHGGSFYKSLFRVLNEYHLFSTFMASMGVPMLKMMKCTDDKMDEFDFSTVVRHMAWLLYSTKIHPSLSNVASNEMIRIMENGNEADLHKEVACIVANVNVMEKVNIKLIDLDQDTSLKQLNAGELVITHTTVDGKSVYGWRTMDGDDVAIDDDVFCFYGKVEPTRFLELNLTRGNLMELFMKLMAEFERKEDIGCSISERLGKIKHTEKVIRSFEGRLHDMQDVVTNLEESIVLQSRLREKLNKQLMDTKNNTRVAEANLEKGKKTLEEITKTANKAMIKNADLEALVANLNSKVVKHENDIDDLTSETIEKNKTLEALRTTANEANMMLGMVLHTHTTTLAHLATMAKFKDAAQLELAAVTAQTADANLKAERGRDTLASLITHHHKSLQSVADSYKMAMDVKRLRISAPPG